MMQTPKQKTASANRADSDGVDAIELLKEDHRNVESIFKEFEKLHEEESDGESKRVLVERACAVLTVHTPIEEEIFYPAVRDVLRDEILGEEALVEHSTAKDLIANLEGLEPGEPFYDATFAVLAEYVKHHVQEEEKEMFPQVRKAKLNLTELGAQLKQRKDELEDEDGPIANGPVPHSEGDAKASKRTRSTRASKRS
jgi:hemerythrin-like domain-containing protein